MAFTTQSVPFSWRKTHRLQYGCANSIACGTSQWDARRRDGCSTPASTSRPSGEWDDDDFDELTDGVVVGRIIKPQGISWLWTLAFKYHEDRTSTHGYAATRE